MATKNDELWISYGVMGTVQQAQGHFQMMVNMVDFDLSPQESLNAPRFSVRTGEGIGIESFADGEISRSLDRKGHKVIIGEPDNLIFGGGQIIQRDPVTGVITGGLSLGRMEVLPHGNYLLAQYLSYLFVIKGSIFPVT